MNAQAPVVQGVLSSTGRRMNWGINVSGRPFHVGGAHSVATRANTLYQMEHDMHLTVRQRIHTYGVSKSSAYRWKAQRAADGRKSALLSGGSIPTVLTDENLWVLCHAIRQSQDEIHTIHDVIRIMFEASGGEIVWTYDQAVKACHTIEFSNKKFAKFAAQRDRPENLRKQAGYLEWIDGIGAINPPRKQIVEPSCMRLRECVIPGLFGYRVTSLRHARANTFKMCTLDSSIYKQYRSNDKVRYIYAPTDKLLTGGRHRVVGNDVLRRVRHKCGHHWYPHQDLGRNLRADCAEGALSDERAAPELVVTRGWRSICAHGCLSGQEHGRDGHYIFHQRGGKATTSVLWLAIVSFEVAN